MVRWICVVTAVLLSPAALAESKCSRGSIAQDNFELTIALAQDDLQAPRTTVLSLVAHSADRLLRIEAWYGVEPDGLIRPGRFHLVWVSPAFPDRPPVAATIRWQQEGGAWSKLPTLIYPGTRIADPARVEYRFQVSQRSEFKGLTYRSELLGELARGGRFVARRLGAGDEEFATGSVDYPDEKTVNALYAQVNEQAIAGLKPCGPPVYVHPPG